MAAVTMTDEAALESLARSLANDVREELPEQFGFTLILFDQKRGLDDTGPGHVTYLSTADRAQMAEVLHEVIALIAKAGRAS